MITSAKPAVTPSGTAAAVPPADHHAERGLVGCCLLDGVGVFDEASLKVTPDDFVSDAGNAWRAMAEARRAGRSFDAVTVAEALAPQLGAEEATRLITECAELVYAGAQWPSYAARVVTVATLRRVFGAGLDLLRGAGTEGADPDDLLAEGLAKLAQAQERRVGDRLAPTLAEVAPNWFESVTTERPSAWPTGWGSLDSLLGGGLRPGQLVVVAARPGVGKSVALQGLAVALSRAVGVAWFTLEMAQAEVFGRLVAAQSRIDAGKLARLNDLEPHDLDAAMEAAEFLKGLPIRLDDRPHGLDTIRGLTRLHARRDGVRALLVDYLGLIDPTAAERKLVREQVVSGFSRQLKQLAKEIGGVCIVAAQLNRQVVLRQDRTPQLSDLRESGAIEQDADIVCMLDRPSMYDPDADPSEIIFHIRKHRGGRTGEVRLRWSGARFSITDDLADPPSGGGFDA
jgi:replicative DNA helicase